MWIAAAGIAISMVLRLLEAAIDYVIAKRLTVPKLLDVQNPDG